MKSNEEIVSDVFKWISESALAKAVSGEVIPGDRDIESDKEDICISVISNLLAEKQEAFLYINIYVQDVSRNNTNFERNRGRITELERLAIDLFATYNNGRFRITNRNQPHTVFKVNGKNEHCISNRILYQIINE